MFFTRGVTRPCVERPIVQADHVTMGPAEPTSRLPIDYGRTAFAAVLVERELQCIMEGASRAPPVQYAWSSASHVPSTTSMVSGTTSPWRL